MDAQETQERIHELEESLERLIDELQLLKDENQRLKQELQEKERDDSNQKNFLEAKFQDSGEAFLEVLAQKVNEGFLERVQERQFFFCVVKIKEDARQFQIIGYSPAYNLDLRKNIGEENSILGYLLPHSEKMVAMIQKSVKDPTHITTNSTETTERKWISFVEQHCYVSFQLIFDESKKAIGAFIKGSLHDLYLYPKLLSSLNRISGILDQVHLKGLHGSSEQNFRELLGRINRSSQKFQKQGELVQDVLTELEGVAEQTKLLSFNASIESARAGVHGKGFAVVSSEIRKLAEKSKKAIENITQLVSLRSEEIDYLIYTEEQFSQFFHQDWENLKESKEHVESMVQSLKQESDWIPQHVLDHSDSLQYSQNSESI